MHALGLGLGLGFVTICMRHRAGLPDRSGTHCITALAVNAGGTHAISAAGGVLRQWNLLTREANPYPNPYLRLTPTLT